MAFRSRFEKSIASSLSSRGISYNYEAVKLPWRKRQRITRETKALHNLDDNFVAYTYHIYLLDFEVYKDSGETIYVEAKGRWTASDRTKILTLKKAGHDIHMLFQSNNKINPGSSTRYGDVCDKNDIKWSVGTRVPDDWLK